MVTSSCDSVKSLELQCIWNHFAKSDFILLHCMIMKCVSAFYIMQRWYVDGTVECYVKEHLPLAALAILMLLFCAFMILFMAAVVKRKIKVCSTK